MEGPSAHLRREDDPPAYGTIGPPRPPAPSAPPAPAAPTAHVPNNPFVSGAFYQAEPVQPPAHQYPELTDDGTY